MSEPYAQLDAIVTCGNCQGEERLWVADTNHPYGEGFTMADVPRVAAEDWGWVWRGDDWRCPVCAKAKGGSGSQP